jgi:hypothetical protein
VTSRRSTATQGRQLSGASVSLKATELSGRKDQSFV